MKKIAIIGIKGIGKDFIYGKAKEFIEKKDLVDRIGLGDMLKEKSLLDYKDWKYNNYLESDYYKLKEENKDIDDSLLLNIIDNRRIIEIIKNKEGYYNDLSIEDKKRIIEITKNKEGYSTRKALQTFGDYLKNKKESEFVFINYIIKEIKAKEGKVNFMFNTDTRFIAELIEFLLNDFYIIKLSHRQLFKKENRGSPHPSELELSLYDSELGYYLDIEGNTIDKNGIKRQSKEEVDKTIIKIIGKIKYFGGYSKEDKEKLLLIKYRYLKYDSKLLLLKNNYLNNYFNNNGEDNKELYLKERDKILKEINEVIKKYYI